MIVPSVDVSGGRARDGAAASAAARRWVEQGARELHLVDLDAVPDGVARNETVLAAAAREAGVACRLAGGVSDLARAEAALAAGFSGVVFGSAVFGDHALLRRIASLGPCATVAIEAREARLAPRGGVPELAARASGSAVASAVRAAVEAGVGALYLVDITADGALAGPPLALIGHVRAVLADVAANVPVHAGGGVRDVADLTALARAGAASAVVGRALAEGRFTLAEAVAALD